MSKKENNQLTEIKINDLGRVTILAPHADDEWVGCNLAISKTLPIHGFHVFDDACLFDPTNVDDILDKVTSAFSMSKSEIWKNRVIEKFAWSTVIDSHVKLYESLVK